MPKQDMWGNSFREKKEEAPSSPKSDRPPRFAYGNTPKDGAPKAGAGRTESLYLFESMSIYSTESLSIYSKRRRRIRAATSPPGSRAAAPRKTAQVAPAT